MSAFQRYFPYFFVGLVGVYSGAYIFDPLLKQVSDCRALRQYPPHSANCFAAPLLLCLQYKEETHGTFIPPPSGLPSLKESQQAQTSAAAPAQAAQDAAQKGSTAPVGSDARGAGEGGIVARVGIDLKEGNSGGLGSQTGAKAMDSQAEGARIV